MLQKKWLLIRLFACLLVAFCVVQVYKRAERPPADAGLGRSFLGRDHGHPDRARAAVTWSSRRNWFHFGKHGLWQTHLSGSKLMDLQETYNKLVGDSTDTGAFDIWLEAYHPDLTVSGLIIIDNEITYAQIVGCFLATVLSGSGLTLLLRRRRIYGLYSTSLPFFTDTTLTALCAACLSIPIGAFRILYSPGRSLVRAEVLELFAITYIVAFTLLVVVLGAMWAAQEKNSMQSRSTDKLQKTAQRLARKKEVRGDEMHRLSSGI